jgi:hypothetical protein
VNTAAPRASRDDKPKGQDPRLCTAIVDRLTFAGHIIETGTTSCRLAHTRARPPGPPDREQDSSMTHEDLDRTVAVEHAADLVELAELLQFLSGWLASDPELAASLTRFVGHPSYDLYALRVDLDRLAFVLGADHDEPLLQPRER